MATISRLTPGQTLYDKHHHKMGNTSMSAWGVWHVKVIEIDPEFKWIIASWNGNKPSKMFEYQVKKLKVKKPVVKNPF